MKKKIILLIILLILILGGVGCYFLYQYTELFGKKIIPLKYKTITLRYVPGYELDKVDELNKEAVVIPVQVLKNKELKSIEKPIHKIKKGTKKVDQELYEITIDEKVVVKIGNNTGTVIKGKKKTNVVIPEQLMNEIKKIVDKNNKNSLKTISTENATLKLDGASITVKNKDNLKYIQEELVYYPITLDTDYKTYDEGYKAEIDLDNNIKVYLYSNKIGYIVDGENKTYGIFQEDLYDLVKQIHDVSVE